jgi:hypothetical protein
MRNSLIFLVFLSLFACKTSKKTNNKSSTAVEKDVVSIKTDNDFLKKIEAQSIMPEWFSGRSTVNVSMGENALEVEAIVHIRKDSAILLVVKKFGFEGARALITPDSVFIINRLEQNYDKLPLNFLAEKFNLPSSFDAIQQLFCGNPTKLDINTPYTVTQQDTVILLTTEKGTIGGVYQFPKKTLQLQSAFFEDENTASKMTMLFSAYKKTTSNRDFSFQRAVSFFNPRSGNGSIDIDFSEVEFNVSKTMRFQIPSHYKRKNYIKN